MKRIFSFGCSFSTKQLVHEDDFWLNVLAKKYNAKPHAWGSAGTCVREAMLRLAFEIRNMKEGDLVVFQFSDTYRIGLQENNRYLTTANAGFDIRSFQDKPHQKNFLNRAGWNKTEDDMFSILDFSTRWSEGFAWHNYYTTYNLLKSLEQKIGIEFIMLFLDERWQNIVPPEHFYHIPEFKYLDKEKWKMNPPYTFELGQWAWRTKRTNGHNPKEFGVGTKDEHPLWHRGDGHIAKKGNHDVADIIANHMTNIWQHQHDWKLK